MAETREGGVYKVGDEWQDANGKKVDAPSAAADSDDSADAGTYPYADLLRENGFGDWAAVQGASDEALLGVKGIGPKSLEEIRAYKA